MYSLSYSCEAFVVEIMQLGKKSMFVLADQYGLVRVRVVSTGGTSLDVCYSVLTHVCTLKIRATNNRRASRQSLSQNCGVSV